MPKMEDHTFYTLANQRLGSTSYKFAFTENTEITRHNTSRKLEIF